ncbi:MAG: gliding motility-associated C-terminal domain-containing protein [Flavobacteriales bacterium]|nr:gliding motility-associated C-terminal domain-containing protein [Flavobacteriales bacterium]
MKIRYRAGSRRFACMVSLAILAGSTTVSAQKGKAGSVTLSAASTVVNEYTYLTADVAAGSTGITVNNSALNANGRFSAALATGDLVFIYQAQGATLDGAPNDITYGAVLNYVSSGQYEFAQVLGVPNANTIELDCGLQHDYADSGHVQVIRVPRYADLTINSGSKVTAPAWDGQTGGLVIIEVENDLVVNGTMDASGLGFRGGRLDTQTDWGFYGVKNLDPKFGGEKGEGIGGYQAYYDATIGGRYSRGAPANGGGGGNSHNSGGGGGGNGGDPLAWLSTGNPDTSQPGWIQAWELEAAGFHTSVSSGGGRGGYTWSDLNADATVVGPEQAAWSGDNRKPLGGFGGRPLDYSSGRLFLGGGGGAGDSNNGDGGVGGEGGGVIFAMVYGDISGSGQIISNGVKGGDACCAGFSSGGNDGAGGGGAGGTVILNTLGSASGVTVQANGGSGGSQFNKPSAGSNTEAEGPGGGGGGGHVAISNGALTVTASGGKNGTTNATSLTEFPPNGATSGHAGTINGTIGGFDLAINDTTVCLGGSVDLAPNIVGTAPGGLTVTWWDAEVGGNLLATGSPLALGPLNADTTLYVGTCPGTFRVPVTVTVGASLSVDAGSNVTICSGGSVQLNASGGVTYVWSPSTGLSNPNIANPIANPSSTTTYHVTVTNGGGCSGTDSVEVSVGSSLNISVTADATICDGSNVQLAATGGGTKFTWSPAATLSDSTVFNPVATPTSTTKYYVLVEDTSGGCSHLDSVTIAVAPIPLAEAGAGATLCMGDSIQLNGSGGGTYAWSPVVGLSDPNIAMPYARPSATTTYYLTVTGAGGCSAIDSVAVVVNPVPSAEAGTDVTMCLGSATQLNGSGAGTYLWSPSTGLNNATIANPVANPTSTTTYWLTVTNAFGCKDSDSVVVSIGTNLTVTVTADTAICPGDSVQLSASGGNSYQWTPASTLNNDTIFNPVATPVALTYYYVQVTDTAGCTGYDSVLVSLRTPPPADAGTNQLMCAGDSVQLQATGGIDYVWGPSGGLSQVGVSNPKASPSGDMTYYVTVTDTYGCAATDSMEVNINPGPNVNFSNTGGCTGDSIRFTDLSNSVGGSITGWKWTFAGTGTSNLQDPVYLFAGSGTYLVKLVATDSVGCSDSIQKGVTLGAKPTVNFNDTASGCGSLYVQFSNFSNGGTLYAWDFGDGSTSSQNSPAHNYTSPGNYDVTLVVTNGSSGCSDSLTYADMIRVYSNPVAEFNYSPTDISAGQEVQFTDVTSGGTACTWYFADDNSTSSAFNPTHVFQDTGCFDVSMIACSSMGCTDTSVHQLCISEDVKLHIPNTITPNQDGSNDTWIITNLDRYPAAVIRLYNRNGNLLQTFTSYRNDFGGMIDGKDLPAAPYYYMLDLGDGSDVIKGILTIIR